MLKTDHIHHFLAQEIRSLKAYLDDAEVTEIMINPGGRVFIEKAGKMVDVGPVIEDSAVKMAIRAVAKLLGRDSSPHDDTALVNASFGDYRIAGGLSPVAPGGNFMSIRKHQNKGSRPTLESLVERGALTTQQADKLIQLIIVEKKNCIIAGATGAGKTTITNAILEKVPKFERIVLIEDVQELQVPVPNVVAMLTNENEDPNKAITARKLIKLAMRLRPDRLVLGETRGGDTFDLIRALSSGHPGSISTLHANNARDAMTALGMLYQQSIPEGATISTESMMTNIASAVNVVVFAGRRIKEVNGEMLVVRTIEEILLVTGYKNGEYQFAPALPDDRPATSRNRKSRKVVAFQSSVKTPKAPNEPFFQPSSFA